MALRYLLLFAVFVGIAVAQQTAFVGVTIVDGTGAAPYTGAVLVDGKRISAVGPDVTAPPGYDAIDGRGKTLLPGLFDLHTHLTYSGVGRLTGDWPKNLAAYLYSGVTSVVDFGSYPEQFEPMRKLLRDGVVQGPRIHFAARIAPPYGHGMEGGRGDFFSYEVFSREDAVLTVDRLLEFRPDALKLFTDGWRYGYAEPMAGMSRETIAAVVAEARKHGLETLTHTVTVTGAKDAAAAGVDVIDHGVGDAEVDEELIRLLLDHHTTYTPTLAVYHPKGRAILDSTLAAVLPPESREAVRPALTPPAPKSGLVVPYRDPESERARRWSHLVRNNHKLREAGVRFGAGTDAGVTGTWHGWSLLRELQLLVHGGLTPLEAIAAATGAAAKSLHVDDERGTIEAGKLADLALVNGAPHERIEDIQQIERVYQGGAEVDRDALAALIAEPGMSMLPSGVPPSLLEDFSGEGRRSTLGTNWVNLTDPGLESADLRFERTWRSRGDRCLTILARMGSEKHSWAAAVLPLTPGQVTPADLRRYRKIRFEARGEGEYRLQIARRGIRNYNYPSFPFEAGAKWRRVEIPITEIDDATALYFRFDRRPGESAWLELDRIELVR